MKIGLRSSHAYNYYGGGFQALKWHILAFKKLGHDVTVYTTNAPDPRVLQNWFEGVALRFYWPHVEREYDLFCNVDHFSWALPEAKRNIAHTFFAHDQLPPPPEGVKLYSNSAYTARHIKARWNIDCDPLYIPIDDYFHTDAKQNIILHVSRFSEPTEWADKGHRQIIQGFKLISKRLGNWKLVMAGSVDPNQEFYLNELARLAAGYSVDFMPNMSNKGLIDLYAKSAFYWHATGVSLPTIPGAQEHMGIAPLEAQASGCVPIVFNSGGMPEVIRANQTGLLFDDVRDMANYTLEMTKNWALWAKFSQMGQMWAHTWMDFDNFVERVDDMLNDRPLRPMLEWRPALKYKVRDVTIVIPTYNSPILEKCLLSLNKYAHDAKILVMNNGDPISLAKEVDITNIRIMDTGSNLGFAGALRAAESLIETPLVLVFNDDIEAKYSEWLEHMLFVFNTDTVGIVGAKLLFPDGRLQHAGGVLDFNREDVGYHRFYGQADSVESSTPVESDFVTGACLLVRRELFHIPDELLNGLNYEEIWMSNVAREKGFRTIYQPAAVLIHHEGMTKNKTSNVDEKIARNKKAFMERWAR